MLTSVSRKSKSIQKPIFKILESHIIKISRRKNPLHILVMFSIFIFLGLISTVLTVVSIEALSLQSVKRSEELGELSAGVQEATGGLLTGDQAGQNVHKIINTKANDFDNTDLFEDETLMMLDHENVRGALGGLSGSDEQQANVNLSNPKTIVRVCHQLQQDIAWSMFKENYL